MDSASTDLPADLRGAVHRLVQQNRSTCLWYMREDYLPRTVAEVRRALDAIEAHGDRTAWAEARRIRAWLLQSTNASS